MYWNSYPIWTSMTPPVWYRTYLDTTCSHLIRSCMSQWPFDWQGATPQLPKYNCIIRVAFHVSVNGATIFMQPTHLVFHSAMQRVAALIQHLCYEVHRVAAQTLTNCIPQSYGATHKHALYRWPRFLHKDIWDSTDKHSLLMHPIKIKSPAKF